MKKLRLLAAVFGAFFTLTTNASVISGTITDWQESSNIETIGDGTNHVSAWWSINTFDKGWLYGSVFTADSDVAFATGITDISQIIDASIFSFTSGSTGPHCDADCDPDVVGDFVVWKNISTNYYGVLRLDDIVGFTLLNATWWFQTDGTADFSSASVVPVPAAIWLFGSGFLGLLGIARRRRQS